MSPQVVDPEVEDSGQGRAPGRTDGRSEEHTSELQSLRQLVCRLLLEKKKTAVRIAAVAIRVVTWRTAAMVPTGVLELALATAERTTSSEMTREAAATRSTWTRLANSC